MVLMSNFDIILALFETAEHYLVAIYRHHQELRLKMKVQTKITTMHFTLNFHAKNNLLKV